MVVHPSVAMPEESSPRDELVRRLVKAQDLHLIDRPKADNSSAETILTRWIEAVATSR